MAVAANRPRRRQRRSPQMKTTRREATGCFRRTRTTRTRIPTLTPTRTKSRRDCRARRNRARLRVRVVVLQAAVVAERDRVVRAPRHQCRRRSRVRPHRQKAPRHLRRHQHRRRQAPKRPGSRAQVCRHQPCLAPSQRLRLLQVASPRRRHDRRNPVASQSRRPHRRPVPRHPDRPSSRRRRRRLRAARAVERAARRRSRGGHSSSAGRGLNVYGVSARLELRIISIDRQMGVFRYPSTQSQRNKEIEAEQRVKQTKRGSEQSGSPVSLSLGRHNTEKLTPNGPRHSTGSTLRSPAG